MLRITRHQKLEIKNLIYLVISICTLSFSLYISRVVLGSHFLPTRLFILRDAVMCISSISFGALFIGTLLGHILKYTAAKDSSLDKEKLKLLKATYNSVFKKAGEEKPEIYILNKSLGRSSTSYSIDLYAPQKKAKIFMGKDFFDLATKEDILVDAKISLLNYRSDAVFKTAFLVLAPILLCLILTPKHPLLHLFLIFLCLKLFIANSSSYFAYKIAQNKKSLGITADEVRHYFKFKDCICKKNKLSLFLNSSMGFHGLKIKSLTKEFENSTGSVQAIRKYFYSKEAPFLYACFTLIVFVLFSLKNQTHNFYYDIQSGIKVNANNLITRYSYRLNYNWISPLEFAISTGNTEAALQIVNSSEKLELSRLSNNHCTGHFALLRTTPTLVEKMIQKGLDPHQKCKSAKDISLLMPATQKKSSDLFEKLVLEYKLNPSEKDSLGANALSYAARNQNEKLFFKLKDNSELLANMLNNQSELIKDFAFSTPKIQNFIFENFKSNRGIGSH